MSPEYSAGSEPVAERPTRIRYFVIGSAILMAVLLYLDRFCVSFAERYIKEDLALSETAMASFISLFFWSYALGQVPSGWLGDRLGVRSVLTLYIVTWSLFTALIGVSAGIVSLLVMRFGCGLAQAGAFPACGNLLSKWVPLSSRGLASAIVALGGRLGGVIAPILTAYLMVVFVPLSTPARLDKQQILDPVRLCARLAPASSAASPLNPAEQRFLEFWPEESSDQLDWCGAHCRELLERQRNLEAELKSAARAGESAEKKRVGVELAALATELKTLRDDSQLRQILSTGLNAAITRPDLYRAEDFSSLRNVERQALDLLAKRDREKSLTEQETERLNRLLAEAVFSAEIGKLYVRGWRPVVIAYGLAGVAVAAVFWLIFRNTPAEHPICNAAELALIAAGRPNAPPTTDSSPEALPLQAMLRSRSLWMSSISQFTTNFGWLFLVTWLARYLIEVHQVPILERSWMAAVPPFAGIAGMFLGGQLTDWLTRRVGLRWGRALPMGLTRFGAAGAYLACLWLDSPWAATIAFACVFFCVDLGVSAVWAFCQDVGGKQVGSILGWGNMWGNIGAAIAPPAYNLVLGPQPSLSHWNAMFLVCAGMFVVSGISALWIDATIPITAVTRAPGERET